MISTATRRRTEHLGLVAVAVAVACLSAGSTIVKSVDAPGSVVAFWRMLLGSSVWWTTLAVMRRPPSRQALRWGIPAGAVFGINVALFFTAVNHTRVANAEFIGTLAPVAVVPLAGWLYHEHMRPRALLWGLSAAAGVAIVVFGASSAGEDSLHGDLLAVGAVCSWAAYLLVVKRARRASVPTAQFMAVMSGTAAVVLLPIAALSGDLGTLEAGGWLRVGLLALLSGSAAHGLLVWAQHQVPVSHISVLQLAQPMLAATWAWIFLGESVRAVQGLGMVVVVASLALFTVAASTSVPPTTDGELGGPPG